MDHQSNTLYQEKNICIKKSVTLNDVCLTYLSFIFALSTDNDQMAHTSDQ